MGRNIVSAKLDIIFKKMFTDKNNEDLLHDFISTILDIPSESIRKITINNPEILPDAIGEKFSRMDLNLELDNRLVNVELQVKNYPDFRDRTLYYWAKLYTSDLKSGENYDALKQSIAVNIINFNMFDCESYHSEFGVLEKTRHETLSDKCMIHFFELKKINKKPNPENRKELWLQLINAESEEELDMLSKTNIEPIQKAVTVIRRMGADDRLKEIIRIREKALHDEASALNYAEARGIAIGEERGIAIGKEEGIAIGEETVLNALKKLGYSQEEIEKIRDKMKDN